VAEEEAMAMHPERLAERVGADKSVVLTPMACRSVAREAGVGEVGRVVIPAVITFEIWTCLGVLRRENRCLCELYEATWKISGIVTVTCKGQEVVLVHCGVRK